MNIGFFTGARSEFHIMKGLIRTVEQSPDLDYSLFVSGMHLLERYGSTLNEIEREGFAITSIIPVFDEKETPGYKEFSAAIAAYTIAFSAVSPDILMVFGDRVEAYAAALAAHFAHIPIVHFGGGTLTEGAHDNIYRYNITNLATWHFTTSLRSYRYVSGLPVVKKDQVFHVGSLAIEAIIKFLKAPRPISDFIPELKNGKYALLTFHPATRLQEDFAPLIESTVNLLARKDYQVLITYPNNDPGSEHIINAINDVARHTHVILRQNLGGEAYYAAMYSCAFMLGNSSSGIIEGPYFEKPVINIGSRQDGREKDESVWDCPAEVEILEEMLQKGFVSDWQPVPNHRIYGDGHTINKCLDILLQIKDNKL